MEIVDLKKLKAETNIVDVIGRRLSLKKKGAEYYGVCPFHDDTESSLQVNEKKQIFKCFACGEGGDSLDFLQSLGSSMSEAINEINGGVAPEGRTPEQREALQSKKPIPVDWKHVYPAPLLQHSISHYELGFPSKIWAYHTPDGGVYGYACRFDLEEGKKQVLPLVYATNGKATLWRWKGFDKPRYVYNAHLLNQYPNASVLIVEGEKTADAAQAQLDPNKTVVITWLGGADGIGTTDFTVLHGRKVIYWRDNDDAGTKAMQRIHEGISEHLKMAKWVSVPQHLPAKWDAADKDWQDGELRQFVLDNMIEIPVQAEPIKIEVSDESVSDGIFEADTVEKPKPNKTKIEGPKNPPLPPVQKKEYTDEGDRSIFDQDDYRILGYDKDENSRLVYFFFSYDAKTVIKLSPSSMTKSNLMMLAPINYWESMFPGKSGVNIDAAQQYLIGTSHKRGIFKESYIRGRGAWEDDGKIVIHTGDMLLTGGQLVPLKNFRSRYMYEIGERLGFGTCEPLKTARAGQFVERMKWLVWEREINAYLIAGWCVIAPFCGVLPWRPHIWVTGSAGSGKSWIMDNVLKRTLGDAPIVFQGKTTEPGIRGTLQNDARPVLFDESDVDSTNDVARIQSILALARASSSANGGDVGKGTQSGGSRSYKTRTCMAFSSIGIQLDKQADYTRFTPLGLLAHDGRRTEEEFTKFATEWDKLVTDDYVKALQSRTIGLLPIILKNAKTFASAAAFVLGQARVGDQLGSMLAGAFSLTSNKEITYEDAVAWVSSKDWSEERGLELTKDENQLFSLIAGHITKVESSQGMLDRSIGELVLCASEHTDLSFIAKETASDRLRRLGILVVKNEVYFSNKAEGIKAMVRGTSWEKNHHTVLARIKDARKLDQRNYGPGGQSRGVALPLSMFLDENQQLAVDFGKKEDDMPF